MLVNLSGKTRDQIEESLELLIRLKTQMLDTDERANRQACAAGHREDIAKAREALERMAAAELDGKLELKNLKISVD
tara:strand:- start:131 stop:361 length:231 start_codon:yes stop_codon:yes gene_type:complete